MDWKGGRVLPGRIFARVDCLRIFVSWCNVWGWPILEFSARFVGHTPPSVPGSSEPKAMATQGWRVHTLPHLDGVGKATVMEVLDQAFSRRFRGYETRKTHKKKGGNKTCPKFCSQDTQTVSGVVLQFLNRNHPQRPHGNHRLGTVAMTQRRQNPTQTASDCT